MATTVPTNLNNPGVQPKSQRLDNFGYIQYPKTRNPGAEAYDTRAYNGAANITLQPSDFIRLIVFISTSTFAQATLPATATLAAYLQRIYSVENQTGTTGGNPTPQDGKVYYFPFVIDNQRNTGLGGDLVTLVAGDGSTTFALGTNQVGRGLNKMLIRFSTAGSPAVATLTIVPDFRTGGTSSAPFAAVPVYSPFPLQDADNIGVWDASNSNQWSSMTRNQFFSGGVSNTSVLIGPGANYAATGLGIVAVGNTAGAAVTGNYNTLVGNQAGITLTTGLRNTIIGAQNMTDATVAALIDCTVIGNSNTTLNAAQSGSIIIGNGNTVVVGAAFGNTTVIGSGVAANPGAAATTWTNRIRAVAGGNAVSMTGTEMTQAVSNKHVKYDIETLDDSVVEKVKQLRPIKYKGRGFRIKKGTDNEVEYMYDQDPRIHYGLLVSEVDQVEPTIVYHGKLTCFSEKLMKDVSIEDDPNFAINYDDRSLVAMLLKTCQHLLTKVEALENN